MKKMKIINNWQRNNRFKELVYAGDMRKPEYSKDIPRIYVLVRDDVLPPFHQGLQATHACILLGSQDPQALKWINPDSYLIILGASEQEMLKWMKKKTPYHVSYTDTGLVDRSMPVTTAIAFGPMSLEEGNKLFKHLKRAK